MFLTNQNLLYKFNEIPFRAYLVMAPDGRTNRHGQTYIRLPLMEDNKSSLYFCSEHRFYEEQNQKNLNTAKIYSDH